MNEPAISRRQALQILAAGAVAAAGAGIPVSAQSQPSVITRKIPSSGEELPVIGLGTWQTFDVGPTDADRHPLAEVLGEFVALGGKVIDSSPMYGRSETVAGDLAAKLGVAERLFVATKVWTRGRAAGINQMHDSMAKLRVKKIDLMQVHNLLDVKTQLDTLRAWKAEGRIRYLGITHYTASAHDEVAAIVEKTPLDFVQINYSVAERQAENRLLPLCRDKGVAVIANRPLAGGAVLKRLATRPVPEWARDIDAATWAQLLLKFVVSHPAMTCAIPATSKVAHLRDNMKASVGKLPDEPMRQRIAEATA